MPGKVYKILCFGDSNTYGFDPRMGAPEQLPYEKRWTGILDSMPCYQVINRGQNGREIPHTQSAYASLEYTLERWSSCWGPTTWPACGAPRPGEWGPG